MVRIPWIAGRYVARAALGGLVLVLAALLALYSLIDVLRELRHLGDDYSVLAIFSYVAMSMPRRLYEVFPFAALIGTLIGLGGLAGTHELTALRAVGISRRQIVAMALVGGVALLAGVMLMAETVMPDMETHARADREQARRGQVDLSRGGGLWLRDGSAILHAGQSLWQSDEEIAFVDLQIYELGPDTVPDRIIQARRASHDGRAWRLTGVSIQHLGMGSDPRPVQSEDMSYPSRIDPDLFEAAVNKPKFMSARDLTRLSEYMEANGLDARPYRLAYWGKMFFPLGVIAMMLIGMPFVFGPVRDKGWGMRVLTGIGLGVVFFMANRGLQSAAYLVDVPLWLSSAAPPAIFIVLALLLLQRRF